MRLIFFVLFSFFCVLVSLKRQIDQSTEDVASNIPVPITLGDWVPYAAVLSYTPGGVVSDSPAAAPGYKSYDNGQEIIDSQGQCGGNLCQDFVVVSNPDGSNSVYLTPANSSQSIPFQPPTNSNCDPSKAQVVTAIYPNGTTVCSTCLSSAQSCKEGLWLVSLAQGCWNFALNCYCDQLQTGQIRLVADANLLNALNPIDPTCPISTGQSVVCNGQFWVPYNTPILETPGCNPYTIVSLYQLIWNTSGLHATTNPDGQWEGLQYGSQIVISRLFDDSDQDGYVFYGSLNTPGTIQPSNETSLSNGVYSNSVTSRASIVPRLNAVPVEYPIGQTCSPGQSTFTLQQTQANQYYLAKTFSCQNVYITGGSALYALDPFHFVPPQQPVSNLLFSDPNGQLSDYIDTLNSGLRQGPLNSLFNYRVGSQNTNLAPILQTSAISFWDFGAPDEFGNPGSTNYICSVPFPEQDPNPSKRIYLYRIAQMMRSYYPTAASGTLKESFASTIWLNFITINSTGSLEFYKAALNPDYATNPSACPIAPLNNPSGNQLPTYFLKEDPANWNPTSNIISTNWQVFGDTLAELYPNGFFAGKAKDFYDLEGSMSLTDSVAIDYVLQNVPFGGFVEAGPLTQGQCTHSYEFDRVDIVSLSVTNTTAFTDLNIVAPLSTPSDFQGTNFYFTSGACSSQTRTFVEGTDGAACYNALSFPLAYYPEAAVDTVHNLCNAPVTIVTK